MSRSTLRFVRFFAPAIIMVVLSYGLAKVSRLTSAEIPVDVNDLGYNLGYVILAAIYDVLPLRSWAHRPFLKDIDERIRLRLVTISGLPDDPVKLAWRRVQNIFYNLIDNDKSLEKRSEDVMFNGAMMTCFADLTALSLLFLGVALAMAAAGYHTLRGAGFLGIIFVVSLILQHLVARRHIRLGENQLDYIEQQFSAEVAAKMAKLGA